jgi:hypothetical protein
VTRTAVLDDYVATLVDPRGERLVRELDRVIRKAHPDLDVAIKYKILMYGLNGDFHTFVCAINSGRRRVALNFLYGVMLDDPKKVLRAGTSVLMSWDFEFDEEIDESAVSAYVAEAVAKNDDYKENRQAVQDAAYAAAEKAGRRPKPGGA